MLTVSGRYRKNCLTSHIYVHRHRNGERRLAVKEIAGALFFYEIKAVVDADGDACQTDGEHLRFLLAVCDTGIIPSFGAFVTSFFDFSRFVQKIGKIAYFF